MLVRVDKDKVRSAAASLKPELEDNAHRLQNIQHALRACGARDFGKYFPLLGSGDIKALDRVQAIIEACSISKQDSVVLTDDDVYFLKLKP